VTAADASVAVAAAPAAPVIEPPAAPSPRRGRGDRHVAAARPGEAAQHAAARDPAARTKGAGAHASGACSGLSTFSHMLCALRECKSPLNSSPKCVRGRQIEQARLARMERE
jgi:hypothetical protein